MICPKCGSMSIEYCDDNENKGYHCIDCNKLFGFLSDEEFKTLYEKLVSLKIIRKYVDGKTYIVNFIQEEKNKIIMQSSISYPNYYIPYSVMDVSLMAYQIMDILFKKMYLLDWEDDEKKEDYYEITITFKDKTITKIGNSLTTTYTADLDEMFYALFKEKEK